MLAVACSAGRRIELLDLPEPTCGDGELLLAVEMCGLCGTDLHKLENDPSLNRRVLGHEVVGTVLESRAGADRFPAGSRIVSPHHVACGTCGFCRDGVETQCPTFREELLFPGGFSEKLVVRRRAVELAARVVPPEISSETALFLEPAACVVRGIRAAGLSERSTGDSVVVGAGSMGLLHLLVLRALLPGGRVIVSEPLAARRELALELGAAAAVAPDELLDAVGGVTSGQGAAASFETVGGGAALAAAIEATRPGGSIVLFAHSRSAGATPVDLDRLFKLEKRLIGTYSGSLVNQEEAWDLIVSGRLEPSRLVSHKLPLTRFRDAVDLARRHEALKVLLTGVR